MRILLFALRQRLRDWPTSLAFVSVLGSALALAGAWLAVALPLRHLPFPQPDHLVAIETMKKGQAGGLSWADLEDLRTGSTQHIAGFSSRTWGLQTEAHGHIEVVLSQQVTGEFFAALGVTPYLGEPLTVRHQQSGNQQWVWFTHASWRRLLGGARDVAGKVVWINSAPYRVGGVLPPSFDFPHRGQSADVYVPLNRTEYFGARGPGGLGAIVRLRPGVSLSQFDAELQARSTGLAAQFPGSNAGVAFVAGDLASALLGERLRLLQWLLAAVVTLLLVAMANASGIWLAQWLRQQRQAAIQLTLGASVGRLVVDQAAQALWLGCGAAGVGLVGASMLLATLHASTLLGEEVRQFELWSPARLTLTVNLVLTSIALIASLVSAALPLVTIRTKALGAGLTRRHSHRTRWALAVAQLTLTAVLAYTGILIWRNVQSLFTADRGFRTGQVLIAGIGIPEAKYNTDERMIAFHQRAVAELGRIPGVTQAAGGVSLPVTTARSRFLLDDEHVPRDEQRTARFSAASPELLPLLDIPLQRGRAFAASDRWGAPRVALVNSAFADRYLKNPLGHRLRLSFYNGFAMKPYEEHVIVGVIGNTLNRDLTLGTEPQIVISTNQIAFEGFMYFLRSSLPVASLRRSVREAIWRVDPEIQSVGLTPLSARVEESLIARRTLAWLAALFGWAAALIVCFGLASSLAATFLEMTRELGIRSALGASPLRLARTAVQMGVRAVALSWLLALPITYWVSRSVLLDTKPAAWDIRNWLWAGVTLSLIGVAAAYLPARRAASVNPASSLRAE